MRYLQSALTGESLPVTKGPGDGIYSGSTCKQGEIEAVVIATGVHTFFGKAAHLVDTTNQVGHFQKVSRLIHHPFFLLYWNFFSVDYDINSFFLYLLGLDGNRKFLHMLHCSRDDNRDSCHVSNSRSAVPSWN